MKIPKMLSPLLWVNFAERRGSLLMHCCSAVDSLCDVLKRFQHWEQGAGREWCGELSDIQYILFLWRITVWHSWMKKVLYVFVLHASEMKCYSGWMIFRIFFLIGESFAWGKMTETCFSVFNFFVSFYHCVVTNCCWLCGWLERSPTSILTLRMQTDIVAHLCAFEFPVLLVQGSKTNSSVILVLNRENICYWL